MAKYRKKPIVIEAEQWHVGDPAIDGMLYNGADGFYYIATLEGLMRVSNGDWIITGVKGEHYPCKPDIFEATYELVNDAEVAGR